MAHYVLAIDETGHFFMGNPQKNHSEKTFVCGVCLKDIDNQCLNNMFNTLDQNFKTKFPKTNNADRKKKFHYMEMTKGEQSLCQGFFSSIIYKIIKSKGCPTVYANNQSWWLSALIAVVDGFFKNTAFNPNDTIEIVIELRDENFLGVPKNIKRSYDAVFWKELSKFLNNSKKEGISIDKSSIIHWLKTINIPTLKKQLRIFIQNNEFVTYGMIKSWMDDRFEIIKESQRDGNGNILTNNYGKNKTYDSFMSYHEIIKKQIINRVSVYCSNYGISNPKITFRNDLYTSLADIECGLVLNNKEERDKIESYSCLDNYDIEDPIQLLETSPLQSLISLLHEFEEEKYDNYKLVNKIFPKLLELAKTDQTPYLYAWDCFYDFLKKQISNRQNRGTVVRMKPCIDAFAHDFKEFLSNDSKHIRESDIDLVILFSEYYSHIGDIEPPFSEEEVSNVLQKDKRILHRWETRIRYNLRMAQLHYNAYNFNDDIDVFSTLQKTQESIIRDCVSANERESDNHIITIINTMAQAYAFKGNLDKAIELFISSLKYGNQSQTRSYLLSCFHRKMIWNECHSQFVEQTKLLPEEYYSNGDYSDMWKLLSYAKLRALDLYLNKSTTLKGVDVEKVEKYSGNEYPFPLIKKWEAIALHLENKEDNKDKAIKLLRSAIEDFKNENNGFTINSLALPVMQCLALLDNDSINQEEYTEYVNGLRHQSKYFDEYVNNNKDLLYLNNQLNIWDRAMLLPFNYS